MDLRISRLTVSLITMLVLTDNTSAQNNFTVTVQFFRYRNPTSKIGSQMNKPCCGDCSDDNCTTCTEDCNNYFIFCLRPPNQSSANPTDKLCPFGRLQTGVVLGGDNVIFVSNAQHSNAFNIPNPFTFDNFQQIDTIRLLVMTLNDSEGDNDSLVEQFSTDILMRRGNSLRETFEGEFGVATIRLSYDVSCAENYYGELCDVFCEGRNDSSGHYSCDDDGNVVCLSGFTNPSTFCVCTATSSEECLQGINIGMAQGSYGSNSKTAAIVGGSVAGSVLLVLFLLVVMFSICILINKCIKTADQQDISEMDIKENVAYGTVSQSSNSRGQALDDVELKENIGVYGINCRPGVVHSQFCGPVDLTNPQLVKSRQSCHDPADVLVAARRSADCDHKEDKEEDKEEDDG